MTPMIDVVFQLLIFFMLTLKILEPEGNFDINMPVSGQPTPGAPRSQHQGHARGKPRRLAGPILLGSKPLGNDVPLCYRRLNGRSPLWPARGASATNSRSRSPPTTTSTTSTPSRRSPPAPAAATPPRPRHPLRRNRQVPPPRASGLTLIASVRWPSRAFVRQAAARRDPSHVPPTPHNSLASSSQSRRLVIFTHRFRSRAMRRPRS